MSTSMVILQIAVMLFLILFIATLYLGPDLSIWLVTREIRKMAALLPEDRREQFIKDALEGAAEGLNSSEGE